ncbi:MAG: hypothetical protein Q8K99_11230 [Actinomycetota bacterium]|nr:hypothetical protein [Actinomycetota bacterium]
MTGGLRALACLVALAAFLSSPLQASAEELQTISPHGGYSTSGRCDVCHAAVAGGYDLVRPDYADDACIYCHVESTHSGTSVYDADSAGIMAASGHTLGAAPEIPGSSASQHAETVWLETVDARGRITRSAIVVRRYDPQPAQMYRLVPAKDGDGWLRVGPVSLRCVNCHEPHGNSRMLWQPGDASSDGAGYKLLRRSPSGAVGQAPRSDGTYPEQAPVNAIENTARAGVNFSTTSSFDGTYTANGVATTRPRWVVQDFAQDRTRVDTSTLSWWCADCHDLMLGGAQEAPAELGGTVHAERTHPCPLPDAGGGPGQCYTCHRSGLAPASSSDPCVRCHYGSEDYALDRSSLADVRSDFPHSGPPGDMKLLGVHFRRRGGVHVVDRGPECRLSRRGVHALSPWGRSPAVGEAGDSPIVAWPSPRSRRPISPS